jgi:glycosyltransferase involved in cell wall biosynthesis
MRIAIVAPPWVPVPPPAYGGTESVLDTLAVGLNARGHDVVLFATGDSTCPVPLRWHYGEAVGIGRPDGALLEVRHVIGAYGAMRDFDVVHDHTLAGPIYSAAFSDCPVVTTNHGPFGEGLDEYYRAISAKVPVIAISHAQAANARGVRLAGVIHHGLDVADFPEGDGRGGYVLFLGRMTPAKGAHIAARVARAAAVQLVIAGKCSEPAEIEYFEQQVRPLLGRDVEFIGEVGKRAKLGLLAEASCLLNPIDWPEPFGMVMIEALACGTPVVTTHQGAAPEIVDDGVTGILADDDTGLVEAIAKARLLDRVGCREAAESRFSSDRMVDQHLAVYQQIVRETRSQNRR